MKGRVLLYGFVAIVIVGVIAWVARNSYWDDVYVPMPMRGEAAGNPFYSAQHLAEALGARTEWRKILGEVPSNDAVLVLEYWNWSLLSARREQLERWVESGGRLVVDATFIPGDDRFQEWSGISRERVEIKDLKSAEFNAQQGGADEENEDKGKCAELSAVALAAAAQDMPRYSVCTLDHLHSLRTLRDAAWALEENERMQVARMSVGRGSVTRLNAAPFGNRELIEADHALLFVAATQLHAGDRIVFLSEEHYASLLELIWTHGAPAVVLALLLLAAALWRNGARFGPPAPIRDGARRSLAEQIIGTGHFTLRVGGGRALHAAAVRALHEAATKRIPGYARMSAVDRVTNMARVAHTDAEQLAETMNYAGARRARELKNAIELLEGVRRKLLVQKG